MQKSLININDFATIPCNCYMFSVIHSESANFKLLKGTFSWLLIPFSWCSIPTSSVDHIFSLCLVGISSKLWNTPFLCQTSWDDHWLLHELSHVTFFLCRDFCVWSVCKFHHLSFYSELLQEFMSETKKSSWTVLMRFEVMFLAFCISSLFSKRPAWQSLILWTFTGCPAAHNFPGWLGKKYFQHRSWDLFS